MSIVPRAVFRSLVLAAIGLTTVVAAAAEGDWPAWRGPRSSGVAEKTAFPEVWPTGKLTAVWTAPTAEGWSSPVVADGRGFITDRADAVQRGTALQAATGKPP